MDFSYCKHFPYNRVVGLTIDVEKNIKFLCHGCIVEWRKLNKRNQVEVQDEQTANITLAVARGSDC